MAEALPRILVVEDEVDLARIMGDYLVQSGMAVELMFDGTTAVEALIAGGFDLAILDIMLPGVDGLSICREVRRASNVPIIMTTAKVEEIDRLLGLELGADDYVCKPYSPRELVARVKAVLRRSQINAGSEPQIERLTIEEERWRASVDGTVLNLTRREFQLLAAMKARPGRVFSRTQLLDLVFPDDTDVVDRTIDSHMRNIRRKIAAITDWEPIRSVYGVGYGYDY